MIQPLLRCTTVTAISLLILTQWIPALAAVPKHPIEKKQQPAVIAPGVTITKVPEVKFLARGREYTTYFTSSGMILAGFTSLARPKSNEPPQYFELQILLQNALPNVEITTLNPRLARSDFFGSKSPNWLTNIPTYARVKYTNLYPDVDMIFHGDQRLLDFDFLIAPGGDPQKIRFLVQGAQNVQLTREGTLQLQLQGVTFELPRPTGYQAFDNSSARSVVDARYRMIGKNEISFQIAPYDSRHTLIIDQ
ncbi:hypothetical protein L0156_22585 [bacterium]|nr:hypothetical protein [bacterium]